jgi:hypothetical protein
MDSGKRISIKLEIALVLGVSVQRSGEMMQRAIAMELTGGVN